MNIRYIRFKSIIAILCIIAIGFIIVGYAAADINVDSKNDTNNTNNINNTNRTPAGTWQNKTEIRPGLPGSSIPARNISANKTVPILGETTIGPTTIKPTNIEPTSTTTIKIEPVSTPKTPGFGYITTIIVFVSIVYLFRKRQ